MNPGLAFFLARRFLFSRHRSGFVRLLTYLSIGSVGLTLGAFVIVMAVMNGFDRDLQTRIVAGIGAVRGFPIVGLLAYTPNLDTAILETPGVTASAPEILLSGLLRSPAGRPGIASTSEAEVTAVSIEQKIKTSQLQSHLMGRSTLPGPREILLGTALAEKLSIEVGDSVEAVLLFSSPDPVFAERATGPIQMTLGVSGIYRTGYYEMDATTAILPIEMVREMFGLSPLLAHSIEIAVADPQTAPEVAANLQNRLGSEGLYFRSWRDMREPLFRAVKLEKRVMAIILLLFGLVSVFSVLSALTATAIEKRRELAALRAMGMNRLGVASVLVTAGGICAGLGVVLGSVLAIAGHLLITRSAWFRLPADIYDLDRLPSEWSTAIFATAASVLFFLSLIAALFPAVVQARKAPSQALREE